MKEKEYFYNKYNHIMENIINIALNLALNIKESIKDEKLEHFIRIKFLYESDGSYEIDELKKILNT